MAEEREKQVQLPKDRSNSPVQVLGHSSAEVAVGTVGGTSSRIAIPAGAEVVEVASFVDCHIAFGDNTVSASSSSSVFPKGVAPYKVLPGQTHLAAILASGASDAAFSVTRIK